MQNVEVRAVSAAGAGHSLPILGTRGDLGGELAIPAVSHGNACLGADLGRSSDAGRDGVAERAVIGNDDDAGADPAEIVDHRDALAVMAGQEIAESAHLRGIRTGQRRTAAGGGVAHHGQPSIGNPTTESTAQATEIPVR